VYVKVKGLAGVAVPPTVIAAVLSVSVKVAELDVLLTDI
jgi:hypothetical protein